MLMFLLFIIIVGSFILVLVCFKISFVSMIASLVIPLLLWSLSLLFPFLALLTFFATVFLIVVAPC